METQDKSRQDVGDVTFIRRATRRIGSQNRGFDGEFLRHLRMLRPVGY